MIGIVREPPSYFRIVALGLGAVIPLFPSLCTGVGMGSCGAKMIFVHISQRNQLEIQNKQSGGRNKKKFIKWLKYRVDGVMM